MGIKLSEEDKKRRDDFLRDELRRNPDLSANILKKMAKENTGIGIGFYGAQMLKKEFKKSNRKAKDPFRKKANLKAVKTNGHGCPKELKPVLKDLAATMRAMQYDAISITFGESGPQVKVRKIEEATFLGPE